MKFRIRSTAINSNGEDMSKGSWREFTADEPIQTNVKEFIKDHGGSLIHSYPTKVGTKIVVEVEQLPEQQVPDYVGGRFTVNEGSDVFTILPDLRPVSPHGSVREINGNYRTLYLLSGRSFPLGNDGTVRNNLRKWVRID